MIGVNRKSYEDVKETVLVIGDDWIREDGMGSSTLADNSGDCNPVILRLSLFEIDQIPIIGGMLRATALASAGGAHLLFFSKPIHGFLKDIESRFF